MNGLYALKPWYAEQLRAPRAALARLGVQPSTVSWCGVGFAAASGLALAFVHPGIGCGVLVAALLAARLACANLDGGLARMTGRSSARGAFVNELSDRVADLVALAGLLAHASFGVVGLAALGATLPSWVALAGAAAGTPRVQGGPVGKTERCALLAAAALIGHADGIALTIAGGAVLTATVRVASVWRATRPVAGGGR